MVSKRQIEESRMLRESEKAMSNIVDDDRSNRVCPACAIMTCLRKCPKCGMGTIEAERSSSERFSHVCVFNKGIF